MLVLIALIILLIVTYIILAPKNIVVWYFAIYALGFTVVTVATMFFVFQFCNYPNSNSLDYDLYLYMTNFKFSLSEVRLMFVGGLTVMLISNTLITYILSSDSKKPFILLLLIPIALYFVLNMPLVNEIFYIESYRPHSPQMTYFLSNINQMTHIYNRGIIFVYHIIPILTIIKSYFSTRILHKRQSMIVTLVCMTLLYINIAYLVTSEAGLYFELDFLSFPTSSEYTNLQIVSPMLFLLIITLIFGLFIYFQSFRYFTIVSGKMRHLNSKISVKNLRMFLHIQKNLFLIISKYSKISREMLEKEPDKVYSRIETINKLADSTLNNMSRSLNLLKSAEPAVIKESIYTLINTALTQVVIPPNVQINKTYPAEDLECMADPASLTECFVNVISNAVEAIELSEKSEGQVDIVVNFDTELICIDITDTGCGISKKDLKHVFKPLFSSKSTNTNYGLGLSYVDSVITSHNGHIDIRSTLGKSTTVQIVLPRHYEGRFMLWRK